MGMVPFFKAFLKFKKQAFFCIFHTRTLFEIISELETKKQLNISTFYIYSFNIIGHFGRFGLHHAE